MILHSYHPGVGGDFCDFTELIFFKFARKKHPFLFKKLQVFIVEFVAVAVPFRNDPFLVGEIGFGIEFEFARLGAKTHGATKI